MENLHAVRSGWPQLCCSLVTDCDVLQCLAEMARLYLSFFYQHISVPLYSCIGTRISPLGGYNNWDACGTRSNGHPSKQIRSFEDREVKKGGKNDRCSSWKTLLETKCFYFLLLLFISWIFICRDTSAAPPPMAIAVYPMANGIVNWIQVAKPRPK